MRKFLFSLASGCLGVFLYAGSVAAKTSYPIAQLGNCRDAQECFYYCEVPANMAACTTYAQAHLFQQVLGDSTTATQAGSYQFPIADLGNCASPQECSLYCSKPENHATCSAFSQKVAASRTNTTDHSQSAPSPSAGAPIATTLNPQFLADAKSALGCDSTQSCAVFCSKTENHQSCENFAKAEAAKGILPKLTTSPIVGIPPVSDNVDCSKSENAYKCNYMGAMCGNFCRQNPTKCQSNTIPRPTTLPQPVPQPRPLTGTSSSSSSGTPSSGTLNQVTPNRF